MNVGELKVALRDYRDNQEVWLEVPGTGTYGEPTTHVDVLGEVKLDAGDCQLVGEGS